MVSNHWNNWNWNHFPKTTSKTKANPERDLVHIPLMKLAFGNSICRDYLIHIPNERKCSPWYGNILRMMGVRSGVSDLFLAYPNKRFHGYWIEFKYDKNKLTASQKTWFRLMGSAGYATGCFNDPRKAWDSILEYLGEPNNSPCVNTPLLPQLKLCI